MGHSTEHPPTMFLKKIRLARNAFFVNPQWLHSITSHRIFPETRHRWRYGSKKRPRKGPLISANTLNNSSCLKAARACASRSIDNALSRRPVRARLMDEPSNKANTPETWSMTSIEQEKPQAPCAMEWPSITISPTLCTAGGFISWKRIMVWALNSAYARFAVARIKPADRTYLRLASEGAALSVSPLSRWLAETGL